MAFKQKKFLLKKFLISRHFPLLCFVSTWAHVNLQLSRTLVLGKGTDGDKILSTVTSMFTLASSAVEILAWKKIGIGIEFQGNTWYQRTAAELAAGRNVSQPQPTRLKLDFTFWVQLSARAHRLSCKDHHIQVPDLDWPTCVGLQTAWKQLLLSRLWEAS